MQNSVNEVILWIMKAPLNEGGPVIERGKKSHCVKTGTCASQHANVAHRHCKTSKSNLKTPEIEERAVPNSDRVDGNTEYA